MVVDGIVWFFIGFTIPVSFLVLLFLHGIAVKILSIILFVVALLLFLWFSVRIVFWPLAIAADRLGLMAGLKASFQVTRRRWWKTLSLLVRLWFILLIAAVPVVVLQTLMGEAIGPRIFNGLLQFLVGVYFEFAYVAALLQFYEEAKLSGMGS